MMIRQSETIGAIAGALARAQAEMKSAKKNQDNPYFKSVYADLASCYEACREPLTKNGIAVFQGIEDSIDGESVTLNTMLLHSSGEWLSSSLRMPLLKKDPQAVGSVITYARRYGLCAAIGLASEDDDAESAMARPVSSPAPKTQPIKGVVASKPDPRQKNVTDKTEKTPTAKDLLIKRLYYVLCNKEQGLGLEKSEVLTYVKNVLGRDVSGFADVTEDEIKLVGITAQDEVKHNKAGAA